MNTNSHFALLLSKKLHLSLKSFSNLLVKFKAIELFIQSLLVKVKIDIFIC